MGPVGIDNEVMKMTIVVTATYDSAVAIENVVEDLVATGIDRDKIYDDEEANLVKVIVPASSEAEVREILGRHQPESVESHPLE